jgi:hypothetical protein
MMFEFIAAGFDRKRNHAISVLFLIKDFVWYRRGCKSQPTALKAIED